MTEQPSSPAGSGSEDHIFAADPVLGDYISHHPSRREWLLLRGGVAYGVPVLVLQILFLQDDSLLVTTALPILFGIWGLAVGWYVLHLWNREIVLYQRGFTYREGSRIASFAYGEIKSMISQIDRVTYFGIWTRETYDYELISSEDEHLRVYNLYADTKLLCNRLERFITRDRLPVVIDQLQQGQPVDFGERVRLTDDAIDVDGRKLAWDDFRGYKVNNGQLTLLQQEGSIWQTVPVSDLAHDLLLVTILKRRTSQPPHQPTDNAS